ncbi:MAG: hypothetical protein WD876_03900 [Candidatus Pacearchaeota archaeon]
MAKEKLLNKIDKHQVDILFGIIAGVGIYGLSNILINLIDYIIPSLNNYLLVLNIIIYTFMLYSTSLFIKGWLKNTYIISSLALMLSYIYYQLFEII